ncbi:MULTISPECIES: nuclear transport factor 2 family protein [unclassified Sphingobacterium]|uniref:nuclear transport factor 2 family protein n=1 Tax=unclassified Sphingobacterium TaxID=2609468 RepID=UPI0025DA4599|nr:MULTISPECIES: nuclear transport factor 2 family protein [unclassified Sphingobacterium]
MTTILLTALLFGLLPDSKAQIDTAMNNTISDSIAIKATLEDRYFKGIYTGEVKLLEQAFYSGALLLGDVKGQPYSKKLAEYLDVVAHRQSPKDSGQPFHGEILKISVINSIAVAEVKVKMYDFYYHEFLSFHSINGRWLIVNKMMTDTMDQL